jgi:hypothetical protein
VLTLRIQLLHLYQLKDLVKLFQLFINHGVKFRKKGEEFTTFDVVHHYENGLTVV